MSWSNDYAYNLPAAQAPANARTAFIRNTYAHLAGAILAFIGLEYCLLHIPGIEDVVATMVSSRLGWLVVIGAFMGVSYLANMWANSQASVGLQYLGLGLYVIAEAFIFLPLLYIAAFKFGDPSVIPTAGILTGAVVGGLTLAVFITGKDFSFLGPVITIGSFVALGVIIAGAIFGFSLGLFFMFALVALASAAIIYNTSNVLHRYQTTQHVAAALALFASIALLFYYILMILMSSNRR